LTTYLHALWYSPLQISLALYFLWRQLGASSLGGVLVILLMIPAAKYIAEFMGKQQENLMKKRDDRTKLNSEVLSGMKIIKLQAWEESFQKRILQLRDVELRQLWRYEVGALMSNLLWGLTPLLVTLTTFGLYVYLGNQLEVASALTALALFEILRFPLFMLPQVINSTVEAMVSMKRLQSFLLSEEYVKVLKGENGYDGKSVDGGCLALLETVSAAYGSSEREAFASPSGGNLDLLSCQLQEKEREASLLLAQLHEAERKIRELMERSDEGIYRDNEESTGVQPLQLCLKRVNMECQRGELIAVVGSVGCGKSSLLSALLGEVEIVAGRASVGASRVAYHSQAPFIMNATVRDNILFGHVNDPVIDKVLYDRALDACALKHDLELLPHGDATEIGEKGVTLSGGE
jgi:ABC-type multidrug transport system fused ATPase/permease subunit